MITFERSFDYDALRTIVTHPMIYDHISDDGSPDVEDFELIKSQLAWYVMTWDDDELLGCFTFIPQNAVCFEVHTCLLPSAWGDRAAEAAAGVVQWMFANSPALRIVTNVPEDNRLALRFAKAAGLAMYGVNTDSYLKRGVLMNQILLGVSKCR